MGGMKISLPGMLGKLLRDYKSYEDGVAEVRRAHDADEDLDLDYLPSLDPPPYYGCLRPAQVAPHAGHHYMVESTFLRHLKELRDRTMTGDLTALDDFFGLYVFEDDVEYKRSSR